MIRIIHDAAARAVVVRAHRTDRRTRALRVMYRRLLEAFGPQHWWPAKSAFEMMIGAILTQATNWHNVERAIARLRSAGGLRPEGLLGLSVPQLERRVRPAGYFRQKARRLRAYTAWYCSRYGGKRGRMFRTPWKILRDELLALHGIGPETADSILLYAGGQPVFVVDTYTMRVFRRHRLIGPRATYEDVQSCVMHAWPGRADLYNEFHAVVVAVGKAYCHRRAPDCARCPLGDLPHTLRGTG